MKQTDLGILLHRLSYSENSLITIFFTKTNGTQRFVYQGGKKKAGNLYPLGIYEITFYNRPDSELGKLIQTDVSVYMQPILSSPIKSVICFFLAEVLRQSLTTEQEDVALFTFLENQIIELSNQENPTIYPALFLLEFIEHLGISPLTTEDNGDYFDLSQGVFTSNPSRISTSMNSPSSQTIKEYLIDKTIDPQNFYTHRKEIVSILIHFLTIHIPNFKAEKCLEMAKDILD
jgi:DNA repair protein RecO (recombination protein O)